MPFVLKKAYAAWENCLHWVEFGGQSFSSIINSTGNNGGLYSRVYNASTDTLLLSTNNAVGIVIFKLGGNLYAGYRSGGTFNIYKWNGSNFSTLSVTGPNGARVDEIRFYDNKVYLLINSYFAVGGDGSHIVEFTGVDVTGLTVLKTVLNASGSSIRMFDIDPSNGDIYYALVDGLNNLDTVIIKRTPAGVETTFFTIDNPPTTVPITYLVTGICFFDNAVYLMRLAAVGSQRNTLSRIVGGVETIIDINMRRAPARMGVFSGKMYIYTVDGGSSSAQIGTIWSQSGGTAPVVLIQEIFARIPAINGEPRPGFFSITESELIVGTDVNFLTTEIECDLSISSISKSDETAENANDGVITVNVTGSFPKQFSIDDGDTFQLTNTFAGLAPGTYVILVKDSVGCEVETTEVTILEFDAPEPPEPEIEGGQLLVNLKPINLFNFITWMSAEGNIGFDQLCFENECWDFPNKYERNSSKTKKHYPVVCPTELFSFYINFKNEYSDINFSSFRLALINHNGIQVNNIAPLLKDQFDGVFYNIYSNVTLDITVDEGIYRLCIYNNVNNNVVFVSNEIQVLKKEKAECDTVRIQWRHDFNIYNYYYQNVTEYVHNLRLRMNLIDETAEGNLTQYRSVSGGNLRNQSFELDFPIVLETEYFDKLAHRAMFVFQAHSIIIIEGQEMVLKDLYKVDAGPEKIVKKGRIGFWIQEYSTWNLYGPLIDITIIGSDDPLLLGDGGDFIQL